MFEDALRVMEEAADIYKRTKDTNQLELANTLNSLAALYWNQVRLGLSFAFTSACEGCVEEGNRKPDIHAALVYRDPIACLDCLTLVRIPLNVG